MYLPNQTPPGMELFTDLDNEAWFLIRFILTLLSAGGARRVRIYGTCERDEARVTGTNRCCRYGWSL